MPEIDLVSHELKNYLNKSEISIQVGLDGFSFFISTNRGSDIHAFRMYKFTPASSPDEFMDNISDVLKNDEFLDHSYQKVKIIFTDRKSTLVPDTFFDPASLKKLFEFNQPIGELDEIHYNPISGCESKLVFTIPSYFAGLMTGSFPHGVYYNQATSLLNLSFNLEPKRGDQVIIQLNHGFFDLVIMRNNQLKLCNNFRYGNDTDLTYYILFACRQMDIDTGNASLYMSGKYTGRASLPGEITGAFMNIIKPELPGAIAKNRILRKLDMHHYTSLFYLPLCE